MSREKFHYLATILGLGKRLREIRGGESQDSFGRRNFGLGKSTISKFEAGTMIPDSETLEKYAALGKTTKENLLRGEDHQAPQLTEHSPEVYDARLRELNLDYLTQALLLARKFCRDARPKLPERSEAELASYLYEYWQETGLKPDPVVVKRYAALIKNQEG